MALVELANARPDPIPVFAEMGSANPVIVTPGAAAVRGGEIGEQIGRSILFGSRPPANDSLWQRARAEGFEVADSDGFAGGVASLPDATLQAAFEYVARANGLDPAAFDDLRTAIVVLNPDLRADEGRQESLVDGTAGGLPVSDDGGQ